MCSKRTSIRRPGSPICNRRSRHCRPGFRPWMCLWSRYPPLRPRQSGRKSRHDNMSRFLSHRDIDWTLLAIVLILSGAGVVQIYSATLGTDVHSAWWRQMIYVAGGLVLMWLMLLVDYHNLAQHVPLLYFSSVALL